MSDERYVECSKCREPIRFDRTVGHEGWLHTRTAVHRCAPVCSVEGCGQPATVRAGAVSVNGDGSLGFRTRVYLCAAHDRDQLRITYEG